MSWSQLGKSLARFALAPLFIRLNDVNTTAICNLFSINFKGKLLSRHKYIIGMHMVILAIFKVLESSTEFNYDPVGIENWKKYGTYS